MPVDLATRLAQKTAVLTSEIQRGVVGDLATFPELRAACERKDLYANTARLLKAARAAGVPVVHCTAEFRADRGGTAVNSPLHSAVLRHPEHLLVGTPAVEVMPEIGPEPGDLVSSRVHGVSPFGGTALATQLHNMGVRVVIVTGISVNVAVFGCCLEAVNLGFQAVVPVECVAGVPEDYAEAVLRNSIALVATVTTVDEVIGALTPGR